jgi:hypothetical protein
MFKHRLNRTVTVVLALGAVAALGASTTAAQPIDGPKHDAIAAGQTTTRYTPSDVRTPDTVSASNASTTEPVADMRTPDARDHGQGRGTFSAPEVPPTNAKGTDVAAADQQAPASTVVKLVEPAPTGSGFDWGDAAIGAGSLLGITLIGLGGALFIVHRRGTRRLAT